jgi:hypothetical protein
MGELDPDFDRDRHDSDAEEEPTPADPCPSLIETRSKLASLNSTISQTRLFDLYWKDGDFVENSFITEAEEEINNAHTVAEDGEVFTNYLIELSTSVMKSADELSITVKEKLAKEFEEYKPGMY